MYLSLELIPTVFKASRNDNQYDYFDKSYLEFLCVYSLGKDSNITTSFPLLHINKYYFCRSTALKKTKNLQIMLENIKGL